MDSEKSKTVKKQELLKNYMLLCFVMIMVGGVIHVKIISVLGVFAMIIGAVIIEMKVKTEAVKRDEKDERQEKQTVEA